MCDGIANPIDTAPSLGGMYASDKPNTLPTPFTSAPPELPGEIAASVCMRSTNDCVVVADPGIERPSPDTTPAVTLFA